MGMKSVEIKTITESVTNEIVEKRSKFIANIYNIESVSEAEEKIKQIKKKYYDAKHNCFAFSVLEDNQIKTKMNDDGEPSGTAGEPILNVIQKNNLQNVLIIVTRYFGGILLGAGGLVRAYSNASIEALNKAKIVKMENGIEAKVEISYADNEKFKYYCTKNKIKIVNIEYKENIFYIIEINDEQYEKIKNNSIEKNEDKMGNILNCVELCRKYIQKEE